MANTALTTANSTSFLGFNVWFGDVSGSIEDTVRERFSRTEQWVRIKLLCLTSDKVALRRTLLGGSTQISGVITTTAPYAHPNYPWMIVTTVESELVFGDSGTIADSNGFVSSKYTRLIIEFTQLDPLDLGEESVDFSARFITAPLNAFTWASDSVPLATTEAPGLIEMTADLRRSRNQQPTIPLAMIFSLLGKVNATTYLGGDPETMLYLGCSTRRRFTSAGVKNWDISHCVQFRTSGLNTGGTGVSWNKFFRASTGHYEAITPKPYATADLTQLGIHTQFGVPS